MSGIVRNVLRIPRFNNLVSPTSTNIINVRSSRSIWHMSEQNIINKSMINSSMKMLKPVDFCGYNCRCSRHTRGKIFHYLTSHINFKNSFSFRHVVKIIFTGFSKKKTITNINFINVMRHYYTLYKNNS